MIIKKVLHFSPTIKCKFAVYMYIITNKYIKIKNTLPHKIKFINGGK